MAPKISGFDTVFLICIFISRNSTNRKNSSRLDYFLWDHLKERLQDNCCPIQDLSTTSAFRKSLIDQIDDVDEDVIRRVVIQFQKRLELCIDANGGRFDFKGDEDKDH